jgi:ectoine hydroxylase-related dioxygenase (phytanoyl-CoA dioxygenase family)
MNHPARDPGAQFRSEGWVLIRGVADAALLAASRDALTSAALARCAPGGGAAFMPVGNLWREDPACAAFTRQPRFAAIAARLLGVERVRLYHDQAMFSEPGAAATPWHQDAQHWAVPGDRCLTMWLALVDLDPAMGTLTYAGGSQRDGLLGDWPIGEASQRHFAQHLASRGHAPVNAGAMAAGDALFHDGWVVHGSPPNATPRLRAVMTVLFVADGTPLVEPRYPAQREALACWTPGQRPGEVVGSPLNPLL